MNNKCFDLSTDKRVGDQHIYNNVFVWALKWRQQIHILIFIILFFTENYLWPIRKNIALGTLYNVCCEIEDQKHQANLKLNSQIG